MQLIVTGCLDCPNRFGKFDFAQYLYGTKIHPGRLYCSFESPAREIVDILHPGETDPECARLHRLTEYTVYRRKNPHSETYGKRNAVLYWEVFYRMVKANSSPYKKKEGPYLPEEISPSDYFILDQDGKKLFALEPGDVVVRRDGFSIVYSDFNGTHFIDRDKPFDTRGIRKKRIK